MSAQAVISMIASALPAAPRGAAGGEDGSGFRGLLAALLSPDGDEGAVSPDGRTLQPARDDLKNAEGGSQPLVLPGAVDVKAAEPEVLPGTPTTKDVEPLVLPGAPDAKAPEPQVLPGTAPAKDAGPLVLPGAVDAKAPLPQVLPGAAPGKDLEPLVLPGASTPRGSGPQVLSGAIAGKASQPQIPPGTVAADVAPPVTDDGDATEVAPTGPESGPSRTGAGAGQTHLLPPAPPPLRALAERTSRPLDESRTAPSPSTADVKATGPTTSPLSEQADQPARPAPQVAPTPAAQQTDSPARAPHEGQSNGGSTTGQSEAAAPSRDHSLSTLSRASIDATAQIAAQIQRRLEGRSTRFEIALRPAELGRVDVKLDIDAEGRLTARLAFDNPAAATDLRGRVDELRRQLEAAGFEMADDAFEFAERDSGSSAFDRGQDARQGQDRAFAAAARLKTEIDMAQPPQWLALSLSPAGVDMKV